MKTLCFIKVNPNHVLNVLFLVFFAHITLLMRYVWMLPLLLFSCHPFPPPLTRPPSSSVWPNNFRPLEASGTALAAISSSQRRSSSGQLPGGSRRTRRTQPFPLSPCPHPPPLKFPPPSPLLRLPVRPQPLRRSQLHPRSSRRRPRDPPRWRRTSPFVTPSSPSLEAMTNPGLSWFLSTPSSSQPTKRSSRHLWIFPLLGRN